MKQKKWIVIPLKRCKYTSLEERGKNMDVLLYKELNKLVGGITPCKLNKCQKGTTSVLTVLKETRM